jgi:hypothetical protein
MNELEKLRAENSRLTALLAPDLKPTSYVYVLQTVSDYGTNNYKIGHSISVERRKRTFNTSHRQEIIEVFTCPTHNAVILERLVHDALWRFNVGGEFFCCPLSHIKTVISCAQSMMSQLRCAAIGTTKEDIFNNVKIDERPIKSAKKLYPEVSPYFN